MGKDDTPWTDGAILPVPASRGLWGVLLVLLGGQRCVDGHRKLHKLPSFMNPAHWDLHR